MTILDALLAWQNGAYRSMNEKQLLVVIDTLNRQIDGLETLIRRGVVGETTKLLLGDLRDCRNAKNAVVEQLGKVISDSDLKTF